MTQEPQQFQASIARNIDDRDGNHPDTSFRVLVITPIKKAFIPLNVNQGTKAEIDASVVPPGLSFKHYLQSLSRDAA